MANMVEHKTHQVFLEGLEEPVKSNVARWLKENDPAYYENLKQLRHDPVFQQLKSEFDGAIAYEIEGDLPAAFDGIPDSHVWTSRRYRYQ